MRPHQWTKNAFIFAALVFDVKLFDLRLTLRTSLGFVLFCIISGVVYVINDLTDMENDRHHPRKRYRPLPAGELNPRFAAVAAVVLALGAIIAAVLLDGAFARDLVAYLILQIAYSFVLKNVVIIDVMAIAAGFVLRVSAGAPLAYASISPWLYICTVLLALFLGFSKRRGELVGLQDDAENHRASLKEYNLHLLDQLMGIVTASIILAYALYTFSAPNLPEDYTMMLTIPFVIYGLFRYMYLIHVKNCTLAPDEVLLADRPMQAGIVLWGLSAVVVLYLGQ
jgi:4-hydroxybenzoate polyprenyltransferase